VETQSAAVQEGGERGKGRTLLGGVEVSNGVNLGDGSLGLRQRGQRVLYTLRNNEDVQRARRES
jgi:hypothetical protein